MVDDCGWNGGEGGASWRLFVGVGGGSIKLAYDGTIIIFSTDILTKIFIELSKNIRTVVACEGGWWFLKGVDGS